MKPLDEHDLRELGAIDVGENVTVDPTARLIGISRIAFGSNTRVDAFCVLSAGEGGIQLGSHVHVAAHAFVAGAAPIVVDDYAGLSGRVSVYSSNDDYTGGALTGPTVPDELRNVTSAPVHIGRHCVVGAGSVVLPGATLATGATVGALSLVRGEIPEFEVWAGIPARRIGERGRDVLRLERELSARQSG